MTDSQRTVAIIYGWSEGPMLTTRFVRELEEHGYRLTRDIMNADIIFAHSSGCYQVPKGVKAELIILTGLPHGPVSHLAPRLVPKLVDEFGYHLRQSELFWWLRKLLFNMFYLITKPGATYRVITRHKLENLPDAEGRKVIVVRPGEDVFMHPDTPSLLAGRGYALIEIPGSHDHCWSEPSPYVDLMR